MKIERIGMRAALAVLVMGLVSGCETTGATNNFKMAQCDGFSTRVRSTPNLLTGVKNCTEALAALDASSPDNWTRRVSLLQARALHHLERKEVAEALADLEAANASAKVKDIYYERSLGLNEKMIRALSLYLGDRKAEAREIVMSAVASRPYSRDAVLAALSIVAIGGDKEAVSQLAQSAARLNPNESGIAFREFFETGRYEQALAIADELRAPDTPVSYSSDANWLALRYERKRKDAVLFWLDVRGRKAYALAALNRRNEALAMLGDFPAFIAKSKAPPAALSKNPSEADLAAGRAREEVNRELDAEAAPLVAFWSKLTRARLLLNEGSGAAAVGLIKDLELVSPTLVLLDFISKDALREFGDIEAKRAIAVGLPPATPKLMFSFLQNLETQAVVDQSLSRAESLNNLLKSQDELDRGGCSEGQQPNGLEKVCFFTKKSSPNVAEERAILRAADKAIARGASTFVIERRAETHTTVYTTTGYGSVTTGSYDGGYNSTFEVRFFKPDDPEANCFRCLSAEDVRANLAPVYRPTGPKP